MGEEKSSELRNCPSSCLLPYFHITQCPFNVKRRRQVKKIENLKAKGKDEEEEDGAKKKLTNRPLLNVQQLETFLVFFFILFFFLSQSFPFFPYYIELSEFTYVYY